MGEAVTLPATVLTMIRFYLFVKSQALKGNEILFMLLRIDWIQKGILLVIND